MQYSTEKPDDNIELRIYPGADGEFTYYTDENNNYNYEHGSYSTFKLKWDDKQHVLTISDSKGKFPGMLTKRKFNIVLVNGSHGADPGVTDHADKTISYYGKQLSVKL